ncbi:hypothetical protein RsTz2092_10220 [Deferribacterales bacterium RsTz2092]
MNVLSRVASAFIVSLLLTVSFVAYKCQDYKEAMLRIDLQPTGDVKVVSVIREWGKRNLLRYDGDTAYISTDTHRKWRVPGPIKINTSGSGQLRLVFQPAQLFGKPVNGLAMQYASIEINNKSVIDKELTLDNGKTLEYVVDVKPGGGGGTPRNHFS